MNKVFFIFVVLSIFSANVFADNRYYFAGGVSGKTFDDDPAQAVSFACVNAIGPYDANNYYMELLPYGAVHIVDINNLVTAPHGRIATFVCAIFDRITDAQLRIASASVTVGSVCVSGGFGRLIKQTSIASFSSIGEVVPQEYPPTSQCADSCVVSSPTGVLSNMIAYSAISDPISVGINIWVVAKDGISQSGQTCGYPNSDIFNLDLPDYIPPLDQLNDLSNQIGNTGGSTGGGSSGGLTATQDGLLNSIYNNTQSASTKLDNIDAKIDSLLNGTGGNPDGTPDVIDSGTFGVMPQAPIAEVPAGGLVSPSETGLNTFKSGLFSSPDRAPGTCPTWTVHIALLANTSTHGDYTFNQHCALVDSHRGALETVMTVIWSVGALALVLKA